jgi:hypothetical protein
MAEAAKGINPQIITPEEVKEEVKEATAEVVEKAPSLASSYTLYAMAATLVLTLTFLLIGLSGNPLSYVPVP